MSRLTVSDFYYGAVLSKLFNKKKDQANIVSAAIVESDDERRLYDLITNKSECRLFVKYRAAKTNTKTKGYSSWSFTLTDRDKKEILAMLDDESNLVLALVCGAMGLKGSELALIDKQEIKKLLVGYKKESITISRKTNESKYRISVGGGRDKALQISADRFAELF